MNPEDLRRLVTLAMSYAKHKGHLIADLPGQYLHWFARTGFPPGEIGRLLALMQALITTAFTRCLILYESAKDLIVAASPRHTLHLSIDR